jgi:phosphoglycolate phosphatase
MFKKKAPNKRFSSPKEPSIKGIMFDMDNTLLQSRIDFPAMKRDVFDFLVEHRVLSGGFPLHENTTSILLEMARDSGMADELHRMLMETVVRHEMAGMEGAGLEPGVLELLKSLHKRYTLVIITNNSHAAAVKALETTGILGLFDLVVGREQMTALKPSPSGYLYAKAQFQHIPADGWISIGDSWIDGRASAEADIPFIGYKTDTAVLGSKGIHPRGRISSIGELLNFLT